MEKQKKQDYFAGVIGILFIAFLIFQTTMNLTSAVEWVTVESLEFLVQFPFQTIISTWEVLT
jgi:hypothetical protein